MYTLMARMFVAVLLAGSVAVLCEAWPLPAPHAAARSRLGGRCVYPATENVPHGRKPNPFLLVVAARLAVLCSEELTSGLTASAASEAMRFVKEVGVPEENGMSCRGCPACVRAALTCKQVRFGEAFRAEIKGAPPPEPGLPVVWMSAAVKDEANLIVSWVLHHWRLGVRRFLVYDNGSDHLREALRVPVEAGVVEIFDHPGENVQTKAYERALAHAKEESSAQRPEFLAFMDTDEFVMLDGTRYRSLPHFFKRFAEDRSVGAVCLNWVMAGGTTWLDEWDDFALANAVAADNADQHVKTFGRVPYTTGVPHVHFMTMSKGRYRVNANGVMSDPSPFNPPTMEHAYILHYHWRSLEGWIRKRTRGRATVNVTEFAKHCPTCMANATLDSLANEFVLHRGIGGIAPVRFGEGWPARHLNKTPGWSPVAGQKAVVAHFRQVTEVLSCACVAERSLRRGAPPTPETRKRAAAARSVDANAQHRGGAADGGGGAPAVRSPRAVKGPWAPADRAGTLAKRARR